MSELTREQIKEIDLFDVDADIYVALAETALAYLDRAEEAERKHEYTLLEEAAQRNRAEQAEAKLADYEGRRWYSAEMMDAVVTERDALKAEVERLDQYTVHLDWCPLAQWSGGSPTADGNYESCFAGTWYRRGRWPKCTCGLDKEATDE